jgi:hypothetical protein
MASAQTDTRNTHRAATTPLGAKVACMKWVIPLVLLWGLLVNMCAHADDAKVTQPHWIIILTITDLITGAQLVQDELDSRLEFDDPIKCKSMVARIGPIPTSGDFAAALTCRKVERKEAVVL